MFFVMAMLFAMASVQGSVIPASRLVQTELMNSPPGQHIIVIAMTNNFQLISQPIVSYQIDRGVSVPYRGLIINDAITTSINKELPGYLTYFQPRINNKLTLRHGYPTLNSVNQFATDLGVRYTSSVLA